MSTDDDDYCGEICYMMELLIAQKLKTLKQLKQSSDKLAAGLVPLKQREFLALLEQDLEQEELVYRKTTPSRLIVIDGGLP